MKKLLIITLLFPLLVVGCRSSKTVTSVQQSSTEWQNLSIPFKLNISGGVSPSGRAYFVRDESIYMSVRYFGMEVMSFCAANDSVFLFDKMHSTLVKGPLGKNPVGSGNLSIGDLQYILLGLYPDSHEINLTLENLYINLTQSLDDTDGLLDRWNATIQNQSTGNRLEASLIWNFSSGQADVENIPQWNPPKKAKQTVGINDLYNIIINQF